jgi:hypothetical protein
MREREGGDGVARFQAHPWDKRQRDKPTPEYKALVCAIAVMGAVAGTPFEILELWIRANLQRQWTIVNAVQYVGGNEAEAAFNAMPASFDFLGFTPAALLPSCAVAREASAEGAMATVDVLRRLRAMARRLGEEPALADAITRRFARELLGIVEQGVQLPTTMALRPVDLDRVAAVMRST